MNGSNARFLYPDANPKLSSEPIIHVDKDEHALLVKVVNELTTTPGEGDTGLAEQVSTVPSNFAPITVPANITLAAGDVLFIQNLGTNPLFVKRGTGASTSSFNYVLQAGQAEDDGSGMSLIISDFIGTVSFAGTSARYNAWKR